MGVKLKTIGIAVGCLLAGLVIGRMLPNGAGTAISKEPGSAEAEQAGKARTKISARVMPDWPRASEPGEAEESGEGADTVNADEDMVWIPSGLLAELSASAGTPTTGGNLFGGNSKIEKLLAITDHEKAMIQTAWRDTQRQLRDLEASAMKSEVSDDGSVVTITVPDLSAGTGDLGEGFGSEIRKVLGENRSDVFLAVKQVDRMFAPEAGERTYRIEPEATGDGGWRYHMTLEGPGSRRVWVSETIPEEISHLTDVASIRRSLSEE